MIALNRHLAVHHVTVQSLGGRLSVSLDLEVDAGAAKLGAGEFWRLGADKSTTFKTTGDLTFGDAKVPAGEYSLWAKKEGENKWSLVFNKQHGQWGTEHDTSQDLATVPLTMETASQPAEQVTIKLQKQSGGGKLSIGWGDLALATNFTAG